MVRIATITPGTIADELELRIGSRIVRINGQAVRDGIDFRFLETDGQLELEVHAPDCPEPVLYEIEKDAGEPLGITLAPDAVRQCANKCVFCFVDGNPAGARQPLHLKDDDFRLSFTYGSYVTLTNLGPRGFQRLIEQRLSPLYVSVHATEPELRQRLLGVPLGGEIVQQLGTLTQAGIQVHTQVVLCPEWNDGAHLERTLADLWALGENVLSLSVVPVGLTRYNLNRPVRLLSRQEARRCIEQVDRARQRAQRERGLGWAYVADEMFFVADLPIPEAAYYDEWPLTENGVGAVRRLLLDFESGLADVPCMSGQRVVIVTGTRMAPVLAPLAERLAERTGARIDVLAAGNDYFGETVTTAGLLPGTNVQRVLAQAGAFDLALLPAEALNDDGVFVDDVKFAALRQQFAPAVLAAGFELVSALAGAPSTQRVARGPDAGA
jgi:putative radical SAM enzyme (TIGR03279 family)